MSEDIGPILKEWDDDSEAGSMRKIMGSDGLEKIQIRVQFGMLQLEADGRPDGKRPYGKESLLEHFLFLLKMYNEEFGTEEGFEINHHDCEGLGEESMQYYHRYVSFFELEDYERAKRDTARNLRVLDLVSKYAEDKEDALSLEKYRPYIMMMNARARAFICTDNDDFAEATSIISEAISVITDYYKDQGFGDGEIEESQELAILKETAKEIRDIWERE